MRMNIKKFGAVGAVALSLLAAAVSTSSPAQARHWGHGGWIGPAIVGGLALGALAASRPYYYDYPAYGYYDEPCPLRRRVVGYNRWGNPIVRTVRVCY